MADDNGIPSPPSDFTASVRSDRRVVDPDDTVKEWVSGTTTLRGPLRGGTYRYGIAARNGAGVSSLGALLDVRVLPGGGGTVIPASSLTPSTGPTTQESGERTVPGDLLDLSRWYLTLPITYPSGRDDQGPWDVYQADLRTFNHPTLFHLVGDTVEYVAPTKGVTTSSASGATRCELREMAGPGREDKASWGFDDGEEHRLTCTLSCDPTSVDGRKECIVGQIHDETTHPPIYFAVNLNHVPGKLSLFKNGHSTNALSGLRPSDVFTYRMLVKGGRCRIWVALGDVSDLPTDPTFEFPASDFHARSSGCYFKAGAYNKEPISSDAAGRSVVRHHRLDLV